MTPAEALAPEPAPTPGEESVTDWLLTSLSYWGESDGLIASLLRGRREQGRERYGTELEVDNGRDARVDQLQEALDLYLYAAQEHIERGHVCTATRRMRLARDLVEELCAELGIVP